MLTTSESQAKPRSAAANPETVARLRRIIGVSLVVLAASAWLLFPGLRAELSDIVRMIGGGRVEALGARLESYGLWGPLISLAVMVLQGIVAPLPAFVVTFANGLAFGTWMGWAISLAGHVLASTVCFALARKLGRGPVERLITRKGLEAADRWLGRWGAQAVFFSRLMPGLSFDAMSYAAGLTTISYRRFIVATTLGVIPETLAFVYLGHAAHQHAPLVMGIAFAVALCGIAFMLALGRRTRSDSP